MEIKYSKKKQEMRQDIVMESLVNAKEYVVKNSNSLMTGGLIVVLAVAVILGFSYFRTSSEAKAAEAFGKAMIVYTAGNQAEAVESLSRIADKYRTAPQGAYSAYMLGHIYLDRGSIDEALSWFTVAAGRRNAGFIGGKALEGIGLCHEQKNDIPQAIASYEKALKDPSISYRYPVLRWRCALLNEKAGNSADARRYLEAIAADTLAMEYRQKAQNLLAAVQSR